MPNSGHVYVPSHARSEALRLIDDIGALLKHDSDRDALAERIPKLEQSLFWFTNTLRAIEPSVNCMV